MPRQRSDTVGQPSQQRRRVQQPCKLTHAPAAAHAARRAQALSQGCTRTLHNAAAHLHCLATVGAGSRHRHRHRRRGARRACAGAPQRSGGPRRDMGAICLIDCRACVRLAQSLTGKQRVCRQAAHPVSPAACWRCSCRWAANKSGWQVARARQLSSAAARRVARMAAASAGTASPEASGGAAGVEPPALLGRAAAGGDREEGQSWRPLRE
jgi:hypothetical protein